MCPTEEFYADLMALRRQFNDDELLLDVARSTKELFEEQPRTERNRCGLEVIAAVIDFLERKIN